MNLTPSDVLKIIEQYSQTPSGRAEIRAHMKRRRWAEGGFVPKYVDTKDRFRNMKQAQRAAVVMGDILHEHVQKDTVRNAYVHDSKGHSTQIQTVGLSEFPRDGIATGRPYWIGSELHCDVGFTRKALHRPSLSSNNSEGLTNIIQLFLHGYKKARASVHGMWHGVFIHTPRSRQPITEFINNAVREFNKRYKRKAQAFVLPAYASKKGGATARK